MASGLSKERIEAAYQKYTELGGFNLTVAEEFHVPEEEDVDADAPPDLKEDDNECWKVVSALQRETVFVDPDVGEHPDVPDQPVEVEFRKVPDQPQMDKLFQAGAVPSVELDKACSPKGGVERGDELPSTLQEAMSMKSHDPFNPLFRLCVRLRAGRGGVDTQWIRNHRSVRRTSSGLNWHQYLGTISGCWNDVPQVFL